MITRCPSCTTRLDLPAPRHDGGIHRCSACGHGWLEGKAIEISTEPLRAAPVIIDQQVAPDAEIQHLISASHLAQEAFQLRRRRRRNAAAAWMGLALLALTPAALALAFPEKLVAAAPATIGLYDWLGHEVNIYGLEIKDVELQHLLIDGQRVIAIKGELMNVSGSSRKIPWLRFGLKSGDNKEVYQWQLDTESRPLRPGETKSFITRIASPPETANTVEIRFARADEIGSNGSP